MTEEKEWEALNIINEMLQADSYTDAMHNVMFHLPLELVNRAEKLLREEKFIERKYNSKEKEQ